MTHRAALGTRVLRQTECPKITREKLNAHEKSQQGTLIKFSGKRDMIDEKVKLLMMYGAELPRQNRGSEFVGLWFLEREKSEGGGRKINARLGAQLIGHRSLMNKHRRST